MMYIYFFSGFLGGISIMAFFLMKELYALNKKNAAQLNQIDRLEKLNQVLVNQISEERVYSLDAQKQNQK
jgi:hypothetical protein